MKILHFEDDYSVARLIAKVLRAELNDNSLDPLVKRHEKEMRKYLAEHQTPEVDLILLDVMVVYQRREDEEPEPVEIEAEGFHRAGIRILKLIRQAPNYSGVPIVLYSNLPVKDIQDAVREAGIDPDSVKIVGKGDQGESLAAAIREALKK